VTWHRFTETITGDSLCAACDVAVAPEVLETTFTLVCPVPPCDSLRNPDPGCMFEGGDSGHGCACYWCGRPGSRERADATAGSSAR
jgi:hypothetical protein